MARDKKRSSGRRKRTGGNAGNPARSKARDVGIDDPTVDESGATDTAAAPDPLKNISAEVDQAKAAETGAVRGGSGDVPLGEDAGPDDAPHRHPAGVTGAGPDADDLDEDDDFDDLERAPDEVEGDLVPSVPSASMDPLARAEAEAALGRPRKQRGRFLTFLRHSWDELKRVQWPNRRQVAQATAVVLGFVVLAGAYLGLMDAIWKPIVNAIL